MNRVTQTRHFFLTRRQFLHRSALAGAITLGGYLPLHAKPRKVSSNEKLNIAIIGASGRGGRASGGAGCIAHAGTIVVGSSTFDRPRLGEIGAPAA